MTPSLMPAGPDVWHMLDTLPRAGIEVHHSITLTCVIVIVIVVVWFTVAFPKVTNCVVLYYIVVAFWIDPCTPEVILYPAFSVVSVPDLAQTAVLT